MADFHVEVIRTSADLDAALAVRMHVFVEEQRVPVQEELDNYDVVEALNERAVYVVGRLDGTPIATGRLLLDFADNELPHIGRVAVLAEHRRNGYGRTVMAELQGAALARGFRGVTLAAQLQATPFYEALGYVAHGPVFLDAGIQHQQMDLRFDP